MPRRSNLSKVTENRAQNTILSLSGQNLQNSFIFMPRRSNLSKVMEKVDRNAKRKLVFLFIVLIINHVWR